MKILRQVALSFFCIALLISLFSGCAGKGGTVYKPPSSTSNVQNSNTETQVSGNANASVTTSGNGKSQTATVKGATTTAPKTTKSDYVHVPVKLLLWDEVGSSTVKAEWMRERQILFSELYPEIEIKRIPAPAQSGSGGVEGDRVAFTTAIASGNAPNAYQAGHFSVMPTWINQGYAVPLDSMLQKWDDYKYIKPIALTAATKNGKVYGVPQYIYALNLAYNKDLYRKAGLDPNKPPKTWDELRQNAVKLTKVNKTQYGLGLIGSTSSDWWFQVFVWQAGGELTKFNSNGTLSVTYNTAQVKTALQYYSDLRWKYNVLQSDMSMSSSQIMQDFSTGKCAQMLYTTEWYDSMKVMGMDDDNLGIATLPVGPTNKTVTANGGAYWFVTNKGTDAQKKAAFEYIKFMTSRDSQIEYYKMLESAANRAPIFSFYKDINPSDYIQFPKEWLNAVNQALANSRSETALVENFRPYINQVVEQVFSQKSVDFTSLLSAAQANAINDIATPYNNKIK